MTFGASRKPYSCWGCEYFVAENPEESYAGYCRRRAPKALDLYGPGQSILTTKGDLMTHDDDETIRLPVGADGQILEADSGEATGIKWADPTTSLLDSKGDLLSHNGTNPVVLDPGASNEYEVLTRLDASPTGMVWAFPAMYQEQEFHDALITIADVFPQDALVFNLSASFPGGNTLIMASYMWGMGGSTDQFFGQVISDEFPAVPFAMVESGVPAITAEFQSAAGQVIQMLPAGAQAIRLQIGRQPAGATDNVLVKYIRLSAIVIERTS